MAGSTLWRDPRDSYIRTIPAKGRGGRVLYQVRPYDEGVRYDLGLFDNIHDARKARDAFWWGKRESLPRFTKRVRRGGLLGWGYVALRVGGGSLGVWPSRELAAVVALAHVVATATREAERQEIQRPPSADDPPDRDVCETVRTAAAEIVAGLMERRDKNSKGRMLLHAAKRREQDAEVLAARKAERDRKRAAQLADYERRLAVWLEREAARKVRGRRPTHPDVVRRQTRERSRKFKQRQAAAAETTT